MVDPDKLAQVLQEAAIRAARAAIEIRGRGRMETRRKADNSPVSEGDMAADREIDGILTAAFPDIPIVSEESTAPRLDPLEPYFLVDPIDGTREYISGGPEFTVNIALIRDCAPAAGIVLAPERREGFLTSGTGGTRVLLWNDALDFCESRPPRPAPDAETVGTAAVSRSHLDTATLGWLAEHGYNKRLSCGSSWKFCLLADCAASVYPRLAPINTWDIAAGHAILAGAGGRVMRPDGSSPIRYGSGGTVVPGFLAYAPGL